jgi:UDP-3-O-[3-hydroxymyristoyl] glucosamine N-acyltransferase
VGGSGLPPPGSVHALCLCCCSKTVCACCAVPHRPPAPARPPHAAAAADCGSISIGDRSNVQDGCVIRTAGAFPTGHSADTVIGDRVTIGHQASLHGCTVGNRALIGMNATLLEGSQVRRRCAGSGGGMAQRSLRCLRAIHKE